MTTEPTLQKTLDSLAGEFFVTGQLCIRGCVASLTLKDHPGGVDVLVYNPRTGKQAALQVECLKAPADSHSVLEPIDLPVVFVNIGADLTTEYFVVPAPELVKISIKPKKAEDGRENGKHRVVSLKSLVPYRGRWDLLGLD